MSEHEETWVEEFDDSAAASQEQPGLSPRRGVILAVLALGLLVFLARLPARTREALFVALGRQRSLVALLMVFAVVTLSLLWSAGQELDTWVFTFFNMRGSRPRWLDRLMHAITQGGNAVFAFSVAAVLYVEHYRRVAFEIILGVLTVWLFVELVKALAGRARPFVQMASARVIGWRARGRSFPSGHTTQAFFLASLLVRHFQMAPLVGFALYCLAALVGFSRMYVGAHYPRDVLAGAMLGTVWGIIGLLVDPYLVGRSF